MNPYLKLAFAALLPAIFATGCYLFEKRTKLGKKANKAVLQVIYGVVFGILAIIGTEWGIPIDGAQVNCRDAAVLTAGLLFGAPAGIIAGVIGGVERWISVLWGVGMFTRVACTVSTIIAGVYSALLRKFMFESKKPGWFIAFAVGIVMEVFHLTMVFLTNMNEPERAMAVVRACTVPMVLANGFSVMIATIIVILLSTDRKKKAEHSIRISQTIQRWLLLTVALAFAASTLFVYQLQSTLATEQSNSVLSLALSDVSADITDASGANLLALTHKVDAERGAKTFGEICEEYSIAEINVIDENGIIVESTDPAYIGFDMSSGEQSREFLCLLADAEEYVQDYGPIAFNSEISRKYAGVRTADGFIQVGYDAEAFQRDIDQTVVDMTRNRHVGKTGYVIIMDVDFNIVSAPAHVTRENIEAEANAMDVKPTENVTFTMNVNHVKSLCRYSRVEGYYIVSILPHAEAMQMRNTALYINTFMETLVFAVLFAMIYFLIKAVVVNRIKTINSSLAKITNGDLGVKVDVRSNEEFASLSDDINSTVNTLKCYIEEAAARIDKELEFAKNIQSSALPGTFPAFPKRKDFDIFASMTPAKEVGGDFYDFYLTNGDTLNFLVADVSGKGIPAAMFMMRAKTELKTLTEADVALDEVFTSGNRALCEGNDAGMFVTAWQGSLDLLTGDVVYANAGHNPLLVRHGDGKFEYLKSRPGFVLAGMEGVKYRPQQMNLLPGDTVFLYTDGVTEATNTDNELFGETRLLAAINSREFDSMKDLCTFIRSEVDAFVGDAPQFDDITMVALRYFGQPAVPSIHFDAATLDDINAVTAFAEETLEKIGCPMKVVTQMNVAIDEIFSNIVRYGYPNNPGPITVTIHEGTDPHTVSIRFRDSGVPYNPLVKEDPDVTLSAEDRQIGGLGIFMVKKMMDDVRYRYENDQNILTLKKNLDV